ncbi:MAG: tetraacyldisaccharide 4'-kinase [Nitrospirales bacterium]|nr:tetraacyldisaccharide 4'-kinase [Nitrospirales bacterium]
MTLPPQGYLGLSSRPHPQGSWFHKHFRLLLDLMSIPYGMAVRARVRLYEQGWLSQRRLSCPVISIGNLTVGGTGKTPFVMWVAQWLQSQGKQIGILSRGYRRTNESTFLLVSDGREVLVEAKDAGDEPYLMAINCPGVVVAVGSDRYKLGHWVLAQSEIDCFILDDGFQHLGLYRDLNFLLVDGSDSFGLDKLLPAGRLREPLSAAGRATAVVVTRADLMTDQDKICGPLQTAMGRSIDPIRVEFQPKSISGLSLNEEQPIGWVSGKDALIFSGIGNAMAFRATVANMGVNILDEIVFPDHWAYSVSDLEMIRQRMRQVKASCALTTEKDAVKLDPFIQDGYGIWAIRLRVEITGGKDRLLQWLNDLGDGTESGAG